MSSTLRATVVASIGLAFVPSILRAEELAQSQAPSMPPITVTAPTASLTVPSVKQAEEQINKTPGGVEVVPATRYLDGRATTMKDMLDYTPGVWVQSKYGQEDSKLVIRGSGLSRNFHLRGVRLLQDGTPINQADGSGDFHEIDPLAQRGGNMRRAGRTDRAATIGRRRGQRQACRSDQRPHHGVRRAPQRNRRQSGRNCRRQGRIRTTRHNQRQRPGPERVGQRPRRGIEIGQRFSLRDIADMHDQRVEIWSPLCSINRGNRLIAVGARSQTIDGFGRHRDRAPGTNNLGRMDQRVTLREKAVGLCRRHRVSL